MVLCSKDDGNKSISSGVVPTFVSRYSVHFVLLAITILMVVAWGAPVRADNDAQTLLAKHRAFVGWHLDDGTFKTLHLEREYVNDKGKVTEQSVEWRVGLLYRNTYTYLRRANTTYESGFTGNVFWRSDVNGFTTPIYGDLAKYRLSAAALLNEGLPIVGASVLRSATEDGKPVDVVHVPMPRADAVDLSIDPATGAIVKAVIDPGGDYETTFHIVSYAEPIPTKKVIGSFRIGDEGGTFRYTKIEPNVVVADAELHPPTPTASWAFSNPKPFPIQLTPTRIIVNATVDGTKGTFILDTGASEGIILNKAFADKIGAKDLRVHDQALTLYDPTPIDLRQVGAIEMGGNTLSNMIVEAVDFNNAFASRDYRGLDGKNYDGLIGYGLFAGAIVRMDLGSATMAIDDPATFDSSGERGLALLVDIADGTPSVPMTLDGSITVNAYFDSGDPDALIFGPDLIFKYHLSMGTKIEGAAAGYGTIACGTLDKLTLGPIVYRGVDACERRTDVMSGRNILVGLDFLRHFNMTFDYPHGRLFLQSLHQ
jgi:Aspartyl protease